MKSIDTSVTISPQDSFFIEYYRSEKRAASRSAVIREAIRLLRESTLAEDRAVEADGTEAEVASVEADGGGEGGYPAR